MPPIDTDSDFDDSDDVDALLVGLQSPPSPATFNKPVSKTNTSSGYRPGSFANNNYTIGNQNNPYTNPGLHVGQQPAVVHGPGSDDDGSSTSESDLDSKQFGSKNNASNNTTTIQPFALDDDSSDDDVPFQSSKTGNNLVTQQKPVEILQPTYPKATSSKNAGSPKGGVLSQTSIGKSYGLSTNDDKPSPTFGADTNQNFGQQVGADIASQAARIGAARINNLAEPSLESSVASREPTFGAGGLNKDPESPSVKQRVDEIESKIKIDSSLTPTQTVLKLRQALASYQGLLEDSEKTVTRLQDARLEQDKQVRMAQRKVARLEQEASELTHAKEEAERNCAHWKSKHTQLAESYMEAEVNKCELNNLREDVGRLANELELSKESELEWKGRAELAEGRMGTLENDVKQLSESSKALRQEHSDAMRELAYRQSDHARVSQQLTSHKQVAQDLQARLDSFKMSTNLKRSPQPMQRGRNSLQGTPAGKGMISPDTRTGLEDEMKRKLRLVQQTGDEWRSALERKTRECEYWMNRANKKVVTNEPLNSMAGNSMLPQNALVLGDQDLDGHWGMSPTRDVDTFKARQQNILLSPNEPVTPQPRKITQTPSLPKTPNVPAMRALSPSPKKSPVRDELLDMAEQAEADRICDDIHDPVSLISAMLMAVNLEIEVEDNERDNIENEALPQRLLDVENAIQEFLFLEGHTIDQDKTQDRFEVELAKAPPKVIRKLNARFKDMKVTLRGNKKAAASGGK